MGMINASKGFGGNGNPQPKKNCLLGPDHCGDGTQLGSLNVETIWRIKRRMGLRGGGGSRRKKQVLKSSKLTRGGRHNKKDRQSSSGGRRRAWGPEMAIKPAGGKNWGRRKQEKKGEIHIKKDSPLNKFIEMKRQNSGWRSSKREKDSLGRKTGLTNWSRNGLLLRKKPPVKKSPKGPGRRYLEVGGDWKK